MPIAYRAFWTHDGVCIIAWVPGGTGAGITLTGHKARRCALSWRRIAAVCSHLRGELRRQCTFNSSQSHNEKL